MSEKSAYKVSFGSLKPGHYEYAFELGDDFFGEELSSFARHCSSKTSVTLDKGDTNILNFIFGISGKATFTCDRCLNNVIYQIESEHSLLVKLEDGEESTDEIVYLPGGAYEIDLRQYIYEFHLLSIPLKKTCDLVPQDCNPEVTAHLNKSENQEDPSQDPRWDILKNLQ